MIIVDEDAVYNYIEFDGRIFAAPKSLGPIDLCDVSTRANPRIATATRLETLRSLVRESGAIFRENPLYSGVPLDIFDVPEVVEIEPIHTCNFRCVMCHVSYENLSNRRIDPKFVDRMSGLRGKWAKIGSLYEPVAHPEFSTIIEGLSAQGMRLDLITNGSLFTPQVLDRIKDCEFSNVTFSFDGITKKTFESIRRNANYERTVERIRAFVEVVRRRNPNAYLMVNYTVLKSNLDEIPEAVSFWEEMGIDHIGFIAMVKRAENPELNSLALDSSTEELVRRIEQATRVIADGNYRISMSSPSLRDLANKLTFPKGDVDPPGVFRSANAMSRLPATASEYFQNGPYPGMAVACRSPYKFARISYDGQVQLCYQFPIGSVENTNFLELWNSECAHQIRASVQKSAAVCHTCDYFKFCIRANNVDYAAEGSFRARAPMRTIEVRWPFHYLQFGDKFAGIPQWAGVVNPLIDDVVGAGGCVGDSLEQVKSEIAARPPPRVLGEVRMYRLVEWHGFALALPKWINLGVLRSIEHNPESMIIGRGREAVAMLAKQVLTAPSPLLVDFDGPVNYMQWKSSYLALPYWADVADWTTDNFHKFGGLECDDLDRLKHQVAVLLKPQQVSRSATHRIVKVFDWYLAAPLSVDVARSLKYRRLPPTVLMSQSLEGLNDVLADNRNEIPILRKGPYEIFRSKGRYGAKKLPSLDAKQGTRLTHLFFTDSLDDARHRLNRQIGLTGMFRAYMSDVLIGFRVTRAGEFMASSIWTAGLYHQVGRFYRRLRDG